MKKIIRPWMFLLGVFLGVTGLVAHVLAGPAWGWWGSKTGEIRLEITGGQSCCIYGTAVAFWAKDVSFDQIDFTWDFLSYQWTNSRLCKDSIGNETWRSLSIRMSWDMVSEYNNVIESGNVKISFWETILSGGNCQPYINSWVDVPLNMPVSLLEKDGNIGENYMKLCVVETTGVALKVTTNTGQAPGNYYGTLIIDLPSFVSGLCSI